MKRFFFVLLCALCTISFYLNGEEFSDKQYFVDSAQMLTECLYVIQKTGRFDIVEKQILSNAKIGKIPSELQNISKRIIDTCQQGKISLNSQKAINDEYLSETAGIGLKAGYRIGYSLAMEDPVTAIWAVYEGISSFSNATSKNNERIDAVLQQMEYRIKSDMYDLRNIITEKAEKYGVDGASIITFDAMEEIEKMLPKFKENPDSILAFKNKYPHYSKLQYYVVKNGAKDWIDTLNSLLETKNSILYVDPDRLNACACAGEKDVYSAIVYAIDETQNDRSITFNNIRIIADYGLKNGGHASPVFHFLRGVANSFAQYYGFKKMSENDIWSDLLFENNLDQGEFMRYQSLWCAAWLATNMEEKDKNKLEKYLKSALKIWRQSFVMNNSPFKRNQVAKGVFQDIMKVNWSWYPEYGFFNDDIVLKNDSDFPITNIVLSVTIKKKSSGEVVWQKDITCPFIDSHDSYEWINIMSISGGSQSTHEGNARLKCEEEVVWYSMSSKLIK